MDVYIHGDIASSASELGIDLPSRRFLAKAGAVARAGLCGLSSTRSLASGLPLARPAPIAGIANLGRAIDHHQRFIRQGGDTELLPYGLCHSFVRTMDQRCSGVSTSFAAMDSIFHDIDKQKFSR